MHASSTVQVPWPEHALGQHPGSAVGSQRRNRVLPNNNNDDLNNPLRLLFTDNIQRVDDNADDVVELELPLAFRMFFSTGDVVRWTGILSKTPEDARRRCCFILFEHLYCQQLLYK